MQQIPNRVSKGSRKFGTKTGFGVIPWVGILPCPSNSGDTAGNRLFGRRPPSAIARGGETYSGYRVPDGRVSYRSMFSRFSHRQVRYRSDARSERERRVRNLFERKGSSGNSGYMDRRPGRDLDHVTLHPTDLGKRPIRTSNRPGCPTESERRSVLPSRESEKL